MLEETSVQFDIDLLIDAERLVGKDIDPDKVAVHVLHHHPECSLPEIRTMVLSAVGAEKPARTYHPPWSGT